MLRKKPLAMYVILLVCGLVSVDCTKTAKAPIEEPAKETPVTKTPRDDSPHSQALSLIFYTQQVKIKEIDDKELAEEDWWFDTKQRSWNVKRMFDSGKIDSTHLFIVDYKIDDKLVGSWMVDTHAEFVSWRLEKNNKSLKSERK